MAKHLLLLVSCTVILLGATNASAGGFTRFFHNFNFDFHDFNGDDGRSCNPVPEPSGALLFAAGGLVLAASKRRNRRK